MVNKLEFSRGASKHRKRPVRSEDTNYTGPVVILEEGSPSEYPPPPPTPEHPASLRLVTGYVPHRFGYVAQVGWDAAKQHTEVQRQYDWTNDRVTQTVLRREYSIVTCRFTVNGESRFRGIGVATTGALGATANQRATQDAVALTTTTYTQVSYPTATATGTMTAVLSWDAATSEFVYSITGMNSVPTGRRAYLFIMPSRVSSAVNTTVSVWLRARTSLVRLVPSLDTAGKPLDKLTGGRTQIAMRHQTGESDTIKTFFAMVLIGPEFTDTARWDLLETNIDFTFPGLAAYVTLP